MMMVMGVPMGVSAFKESTLILLSPNWLHLFILEAVRVRDWMHNLGRIIPSAPLSIPTTAW